MGRHIRLVVAGLFVLLSAACARGVTPTQSGSGTSSTGTTSEPPTVSEVPPPTCTPVPEVVGLYVSSAKSSIASAGLDESTKQRESDKTAGTVLSQKPASGKCVDAGAKVVLTVAKARIVVVPDVTLMDVDSAKEILTDKGFKISTKQQTSSQPPGTVLSQSPRAGSKVAKGSTVTLTVAKSAVVCTDGYKPCLPVGPSDYDCYGGSGNGPAYTEPGVVYQVSGSDPYGLDSDNDGSGCE
jgi:hypothetical protein